jgi:hypothetical protein
MRDDLTIIGEGAGEGAPADGGLAGPVAPIRAVIKYLNHVAGGPHVHESANRVFTCQ